MTEIAPPPSQQFKAEPIYQSAYYYRRIWVFCGSLFLLVVFLPAFVRFALVCADTSQASDERLLLLVPTTIFGLFALVGGLLLRYHLIDHSIPLIIDGSGVLYGTKQLAWADVRSLSGIRQRRSIRIQLMIRQRGRIFSSRQLSTTDGLTPAQYERLMVRLRQEIAPFHKHLEFI